MIFALAIHLDIRMLFVTIKYEGNIDMVCGWVKNGEIQMLFVLGN